MKTGIILARFQPIEKEYEELKKWVPDCVFESRETIRKRIELANMIK